MIDFNKLRFSYEFCTNAGFLGWSVVTLVGVVVCHDITSNSTCQVTHVMRDGVFWPRLQISPRDMNKIVQASPLSPPQHESIVDEFEIPSKQIAIGCDSETEKVQEDDHEIDIKIEFDSCDDCDRYRNAGVNYSNDDYKKKFKRYDIQAVHSPKGIKYVSKTNVKRHYDREKNEQNDRSKNHQWYKNNYDYFWFGMYGDYSWYGVCDNYYGWMSIFDDMEDDFGDVLCNNSSKNKRNSKKNHMHTNNGKKNRYYYKRVNSHQRERKTKLIYVKQIAFKLK